MGGVHDGCMPPLPFRFLPNNMERHMDKTRPTVAQLLSRTATLPVDKTSGGGLIDRLLGGGTDVRTNARLVLETLYAMPGMDAVSGYRREDTQVGAGSVNGIVSVTLVRPGHPRVTITPGATASEKWSVVGADGQTGRAMPSQIPATLATMAGRPRRRSGSEGALEREAIDSFNGARNEIALIVAGLCAIASTLAQISVGAGGLVDAVVAGLVAGLLVFLVVRCIIWGVVAKGRRMIESDEQTAAPPRDALWEALRTGYDAHGVVMERLRLRASEASLALDLGADARGLELTTLLDRTLSRLSSAYSEALAMRGDGKALARVETHCVQVLEEVVSGMEREAEARRQLTFEKVEDLRLHARRIVGDDPALPSR